jgi:hypothetical protein
MWLDPTTGKIHSAPGEWEEALRTADPLMRKGLLHPELLTQKEKEDLALKTLSFLADYLPRSGIEELVQENLARAKESSHPACDEAARQMLEGKLALRDIGATQQQHFERALLNVQTGQIITESDVAAMRKKLREKKKKAKTSGKTAKDTKPKRRKRQ